MPLNSSLQIARVAPRFAALLAVSEQETAQIPPLDFPNERRNVIPLIAPCPDSKVLLPILDYPSSEKPPRRRELPPAPKPRKRSPRKRKRHEPLPHPFA